MPYFTGPDATSEANIAWDDEASFSMQWTNLYDNLTRFEDHLLLEIRVD